MARDGGIAEKERRGCPAAICGALVLLLLAVAVAVGGVRRQRRARPVAAAVTGRGGVATIVIVAGVLELVLQVRGKTGCHMSSSAHQLSG